MFERILVVCHANICRSPMAAARFSADRRVQHAGISIQSAGLGAVDGRQADPVVVSLLAECGIDLRQHRSRRITMAQIRAAQLVLVMEKAQVKDVEEIDNTAKGKVHLLGKWDGLEVADPYRQGEGIYRGSAGYVERAVANWIRKIC